LGPESRIPIPPSGAHYYANDAAAPFLPTADGSTNMTFWVGGQAFRSTGDTLDTMGPVNPTTAVLKAGPSGSFDGNGVWLINAIRRPDGSLIGVYHAEDHTFADGTYGEWNTTGLAISTDDGVTWAKQGQIIGNLKPGTGTFGGVEATCVFYNHLTSKWIGIGHGTGFESSDPNAAPGTWKGWYNGAFTTPMTPLVASPQLSTLPGLSSNIMACKAHWNEYLGQFILVWQAFGSKDVRISASWDGVHWGPSALLYTGESAYAYPQIMGISDVWAGQNAVFVYAKNSTDTSDRYRDMCMRWVNFGPMAAPQTPTTLTATPSKTASQIDLRWKGVPQAQSYDVLRGTTAGGPYSVIASVASSLGYPIYQDTQVTPEVPYFYRVQAKNTVGTSANSNEATTSATYFRIYNRKSNLPLDVAGGVTTAGANLIQAADSSNASQEWRIINVDGTYFEIMNHNSNLAADVTGASTTDGAKVVQWNNYHGTNQQWRIVKQTNGAFEIINRNSGKVMDVTGGSLSPGTQVLQWTNNHAANQQWQILPSP
jgi:hypothetical protein